MAPREQRVDPLVITTGAIIVGGMVFARPLVDLYAGDFARVPGQLNLTVRLARIACRS